MESKWIKGLHITFPEAVPWNGYILDIFKNVVTNVFGVGVVVQFIVEPEDAESE